MNNNPEHCFDPSCVLQLKPHDDPDGSKHKGVIDRHQLFYQLNQPINNLDCLSQAYDFISLALQEVSSAYSSKYTTQDKFSSLQVLPIVPLSSELLTETNLHQSLNQSSSILLTQPCWLKNIFQTFSSQSRVGLELMSIYLQLTRAEWGKPNLIEACHSLLLASNIHIPVLHSYSYSQQIEILPEMIDFSCIQLALTRFPRVLFPELLGFTLAYCQTPTLIEVCFPEHQLPTYFFKLRQQRAKQQISRLLHCISGYLDLFSGQKECLWWRIENGFWLYHAQMQYCRDAMNRALQKKDSSAQAVTLLFQQKTSAAIGHHQKIQLQGKSLDSWFAGMPENSKDFLQALRQSDYVNKQSPEKSRLLKIFDFKGPMFGVLNESELCLIKDWLKTEENTITTASETSQSFYSGKSRLITTHCEKISNRQLYYYLVNADLYPELLSASKIKVIKLLKACRLLNPLPFKHYNHQQFDSFIKAIYQREIKAYQPIQGKPKISKQAYVWGLEQVAPMILIDGCWLQNGLSVQNKYPDIAEIFFSIYCDELGNGKIEQSHPVIFQQLLDSLSIKVPSVYSEQFIKHTGFIESAFDLPVYMMGLSHYSIEFLPELLGLNMAIELSGLGKSYMRLVDEWKYWGIDPTIASIHISIDNVESGHTFLAKKAIQIYMDDAMQQTGNTEILDQLWRRIYTGYASLRFVGWRFKLSLPFNFLINKMVITQRN